eukprot:UN25079
MGVCYVANVSSVKKSTRKTTLYIGNLPYDYDPEIHESELKTLIEKQCGKQLVSIRSKVRYAFCEFLNFEHTQVALLRLPNTKFKGRELRVELAHTPADVTPEDKPENLKKCLFIRNIAPKIKESELRKEFEKFGEITRCEIIRDKDGNSKLYGFVGFRAKSAADTAYKDMHRTVLGGKEITVEFAKPKQPDYATPHGRRPSKF